MVEEGEHGNRWEPVARGHRKKETKRVQGNGSDTTPMLGK